MRFFALAMTCTFALTAVSARVAVSATAAAPDASAGVPDSVSLTTRSDYAATLPTGRAVMIDNPYGDVHVRFGGFEHKVETHAVLQEPNGAAHIALEPGDTQNFYSLVPRLPAGTTLSEGQRLDLAVLIPEGHALRVRTEQGEIDVHGVRGDVDLRSGNGNINLRGISGAIRAETGAGQIEAALGTAPRKSAQRLATRTGMLIVAVDDALDADVELATSGVFATEYSLKVMPRPGEEPNKRARSLIGRDTAKLTLESRRGEIRLLRRAGFTQSDGKHQEVRQAQQDNDSD